MYRSLYIRSVAHVLILAALSVAGCGTRSTDSHMANTDSMDSEPIVVGGVYSIDDGDGRVGVVKVLAKDDSAVHVRIYKNKFNERPKSIDTSTLSLGKIGDSDGFGIGHAPLAKEGFKKWNPEFLVTETVTDRELEGYKLYIEAMKEH